MSDLARIPDAAIAPDYIDPRPTRHRGLFGNPIVLKELRGRMRGARAFVVLTVYLLLMSGFTTLLYIIAASTRDINGFSTGGQIGRTLFVGIVGIELFLVTFIAPAFTAGAISGERERQTYDLLRTTMLPPRALVTGKLVSALAYVLLLLIAAIPLQSIAFLFGGVTEAEVILAFVILLMTAVMLGAVGIFFSARTERTLAANITTYAFTLTITIGLPLVVYVVATLLSTQIARFPAGIQAVLYYILIGLAATNPLAAAFITQQVLFEKQSAVLFTHTVVDPVTGATQTLTLISPWIPFVVLYLVIAVVMVVRAMRRVSRIEA
jgi:ABC-type transport system involved in multi-copper enzyme maturation permease subunit